MSPRSLRRVLLVGFMGSGKTDVGHRLADKLAWRFIDFDDVIEAEESASVSDIFATRGEGHFRSVEERVASRLLVLDDVILGSGGGWAAKQGRLDGLPSGTETFWLQVTVEEALRRVASQPGRRPLLERSDASDYAETLLRERIAEYGRADWAVDTTGLSVEDVSARILEILAWKYPETRIE